MNFKMQILNQHGNRFELESMKFVINSNSYDCMYGICILYKNAMSHRQGQSKRNGYQIVEMTWLLDKQQL